MLFTFNNIQAITFLITSFVDLFAIIVIAVSVSFSILPLMKTTIKSILFASKSAVKKSEEEDKEDQMKNKGKIAKENFIRGLLLALEFESANAILKMGVFTSILTGTITASTFNLNNFIFFVGVFSVRIAINQTLRRFSIN
jgi:hypothetical protein